MSKSYRKFPLFKATLWGGSHSRSMKAGKTFSNRRLRHKLKNVNIDVSNGNYYRRLGVDRWELYGYSDYKTKQDVIAEWEKHQAELINEVKTYRYYNPTLEEALLDWKKSYLNK